MKLLGRDSCEWEVSNKAIRTTSRLVLSIYEVPASKIRDLIYF